MIYFTTAVYYATTDKFKAVELMKCALVGGGGGVGLQG